MVVAATVARKAWARIARMAHRCQDVPAAVLVLVEIESGLRDLERFSDLPPAAGHRDGVYRGG